MKIVVAGLAIVLMLSACQQQEESKTQVESNAKDEDSSQQITELAEIQLKLLGAGYTPFPDNYDYPQTNETVSGWVSGRKGHRIREHGWYLWAGLNQPVAGTNEPIWRSWPTSTYVFPRQYKNQKLGDKNPAPKPVIEAASINAKHQLNAGSQASAHGDITDPIDFKETPAYTVPESVKNNYSQCYLQDQMQLKDGPSFQNNGDVMVAGVIYDLSAAERIRLSRSFSASQLNKKIPASGTDQPTHQYLPDQAIVLKPMLWPVRGDGYTALPVWDDLSPDSDKGQYAGFEIKHLWKRAVAVTGNASPPATQDVTYLVQDVSLPNGHTTPVSYSSAPVVGVDSFYHHQYDEEELSLMDDCDRAILDASAYWSYGRAFQKGDYLVLIAMHIMTHEQDGWTFQSAWWHDQPDKGRYAGNRPDIPDAVGPWQHYLLTTTYGMPQQPDHDNNWPPCMKTQTCKNNNKWPVAYNPYIELAAAHPIATNCRNCHWRAGWPSARHAIAGRPTSSYLAQPTSAVPNPPDVLDVFTINDPFLNGLLTLDAMWAVADRAN